MIKKNEETNGEMKNVSSFKKFSEMTHDKKPKNGEKDQALQIKPDDDSNRPALPNLPSKSSKKEVVASTDYLKPKNDKEVKDENVSENVNFYGKVAKLPKGIKASKGFNFLENVKVSKSSIWYIMVEKQENELQMVKYNHKKGVDLSKFVSDLKTYYISKYSGSEKIVKLIESIEIDGNDKYSCVKNIPLVDVEGRKMISIITEDLIKLLSK
jgi:hypothetical protein